MRVKWITGTGGAKGVSRVPVIAIAKLADGIMDVEGCRLGLVTESEVITAIASGGKVTVGAAQSESTVRAPRQTGCGLLRRKSSSIALGKKQAISRQLHPSHLDVWCERL